MNTYGATKLAGEALVNAYREEKFCQLFLSDTSMCMAQGCVEDVARANLVALESRVGGVFNTGSGSSITISELVKLILEITESKSLIIRTDPRPDNIRHSEVDVKRVAKLLDWIPSTELKEGLRKTIELH